MGIVLWEILGTIKKIRDATALGRRASYDPQPRKSSKTYLTIQEGVVVKPKADEAAANTEFDNLRKWKKQIVDKSTKFKMHSPEAKAITEEEGTGKVNLHMSLCPGKSLEEILNAKLGFTKEDFISILEHLGALFKLKHDSSLKHGDLSLENIFVNKNPEDASLSLGVTGLSKLKTASAAEISNEHQDLLDKVIDLIVSPKFREIFSFVKDEIDTHIQRGKDSKSN